MARWLIRVTALWGSYMVAFVVLMWIWRVPIQIILAIMSGVLALGSILLLVFSTL